jgi:manganese efflux pump family protein
LLASTKSLRALRKEITVGALLLMGFVVGLDNFRVAVGLGTLNLTHQRRVHIALAFCLCEALAPLVGLKIGNVLIDSISIWVEAIGPIVLGGSGLYIIYRTLRHEEEDRLFDSRWVIFGLPISLSLDNLLAGVGLGMLGLPILLSTLVIGAISGMMCVIGLLVGGAVARYLPCQAELLSGVILLMLAMALVIGH